MPFQSRGRVALSLALTVAALGACTQTTMPPAPRPGTAASVAPSAFRLPDGSGCSGEVARFQAVLQNDVETGNVARSVYDRAEPDLTRAQAACAAGRDGEARVILAGTKSRFGYR